MGVLRQRVLVRGLVKMQTWGIIDHSLGISLSCSSFFFSRSSQGAGGFMFSVLSGFLGFWNVFFMLLWRTRYRMVFQEGCQGLRCVHNLVHS